MTKPWLQLVRSRDGSVWHLLRGGSPEAACGATLRHALTIAGRGLPSEVIELHRDRKREFRQLPLCPMCF